jgi:hypothetical protein
MSAVVGTGPSCGNSCAPAAAANDIARPRVPMAIGVFFREIIVFNSFHFD